MATASTIINMASKEIGVKETGGTMSNIIRNIMDEL